MAKENKPRQSEKVKADCPHCGFSQLESSYAKSTFCRKCGQHFSIEKLLAREAVSLKALGFFDKLTKLIVRETVHDVTCFSCGHRQTVAGAAQSTLCPQCGSYVDLKDFKIDGPFGRSIQTQGDVIISAKGDCSGARIACASARLEGKVRGHLVATNEIRVRTKEKVTAAIETRNLIIEKKCNCEFVRPIKADNIEINGRISARVVCNGKVKINKGGTLEGILYAKSIVVEKGGIFSGELCIRQNPNEEVEKMEQGTLFGGEGDAQLSPA